MSTISTVTSFAAAPTDLLTRTYAAPDAIPVEFFMRATKGVVWGGTLGDESFWLETTLNTGALDPAPAEAQPLLITGSAVSAGDVVTTGGATYGTLYSALSGGGSYHDLQVGDWLASAVAAWSELPDVIEATAPGVARAGDGNHYIEATSTDPLQVYSGLRPRTDWAGEASTFVDSLGFAGSLFFYLRSIHHTGNFAVPAGDNNQFVGLLRRGAMDARAGDLTPDDVVVGVLVQGASARFIVNGVTLHSVACSAAGLRLIEVDLAPASDMTGAPPIALDEIAFNVTRLRIQEGAAPAGTVTWSTLLDTLAFPVSVQMAEAVTAIVGDIDYTNDAFMSNVGTLGITQMTGATLWGAFYPSPSIPPFWTNLRRSVEIIE